ncbi:hypothetical protein [Flavobacterium sp.]|uniref:hypothetical protein n=1 Tax=Flavobacterium sp. TaxID=239 RepID=UPI00333F8317
MFKIYPLSEDLNAKEYYNLVYEKVGTEWNEIIFFNTEKANPTDARTLESSEMVYNRISGREGFSEVITYSFHCTGCTGPCDMCNKCVSTHVSYIYTGIQNSGSGNNGIPTGTGNNNNGNSGGGSDEYSGIFIPNSYDGDVDLNNVDFIFAGQVIAYTSSLTDFRDVMSNNFWLFYDIKEFFKNNGGLTRANKGAVEYALSNIQAIFTTLSQNSNDLTTVQINQTKQSAFVFLLQHGAWLSGQSATTQQSILQNLTSLEKIEKIDKLTDVAEITGTTFTIDPTVNATNGQVFNNANDLEDYLNTGNSSNCTTQVNNINLGERISKAVFDLGIFINLELSVKQNTNPFSVTAVTSEITGMTLGKEWHQTNSTTNNTAGFPNSAEVDVYGNMVHFIFLEGIGTVFTASEHFQIKFLKNNGSIYATIHY